MATQAKTSKPRDRDRDKVELWVVKLTGPGNYRIWKDQMENFLATHEGLLQLVKGEFTLPTEPPTPDIYRQDQLAFEEHLRSLLPPENTLPGARELDMRYRTYQSKWDKYEADIKTHEERNRSARDYLYRSMNKTCRSQILGIDNAKGI